MERKAPLQTSRAKVSGSGARRGGAVSAIGGHNAAMAVLESEALESEGLMSEGLTS
jgi:hypothetical protein